MGYRSTIKSGDQAFDLGAIQAGGTELRQAADLPQPDAEVSQHCRSAGPGVTDHGDQQIEVRQAFGSVHRRGAQRDLGSGRERRVTIRSAIIDTVVIAKVLQRSFGSKRVEREEFCHLGHLTASGRNDAEEQMLSSTMFVAHGAGSPQRHIEGQPRTGVQQEAIHLMNRTRRQRRLT